MRIGIAKPSMSVHRTSLALLKMPCVPSTKAVKTKPSFSWAKVDQEKAKRVN
jgi:hypothetical protein